MTTLEELQSFIEDYGIEVASLIISEVSTNPNFIQSAVINNELQIAADYLLISKTPQELSLELFKAEQRVINRRYHEWNSHRKHTL